MTNSDTELSDFTKLVLARLETNPDEFTMHGRWDTLVRALEAHALGDTESKYARTLWPLGDAERDVMFEAYRKMYLARLHKDMLKNIVSGNDLGPSPEQTFQAGLGKQASQGVLRGNSPSTVLTTAAMAVQAKSVLDSEFNKAYTDALSNAIVKGEGQMVQMADTNTAYTYKSTNRYVLNRSQVEIARKLGISPTEYAKLIEAHE
jgi:hypothetical protein